MSATLFLDEAAAMTDTMQKSTVAKLASHGETAVQRTMQLVKIGVFAVSVAAAIPTARNLYFSWKNDVPFAQVEHRLGQADLWEKNYDCKIEYRTLSTAASPKVEVGSCSKTKDISIRVSGNGQTNYEWIAFDQLPKPATQSASFLDLFIASAYAGERSLDAKPADASIVVAQAATEVVCQNKTKDTIIKVVKDGAKCFRETVSLFKGTVEKREEVPCNTQCTAK